ncbi:MAG: hypothetical protein V1872_12940 [bacterium]
MSKTLEIPDKLYTQLENMSQEQGLLNIQELLESWQKNDRDIHYRREVVKEIDTLRERLFVTYGEMQDSVELVGEDKDRGA